MNYREKTKKTIVVRVNTICLPKTDPLFPDLMFKNGESPSHAWGVFLTLRTGISQENTGLRYFTSESQAAEFAERFVVGAEIAVGAEMQTGEITSSHVDLITGMIDTGGRFLGIASAGDEESPLAYDVLEAAGINEGLGLSEEVLDFIQEPRIQALKEKHGENWRVAAAFQYCWLKLPHTSAAFTASAYQFHHYISCDEFSAGYYWRELEIIKYGVEVEAEKAIALKIKAGVEGGKKSAQARHLRIVALMAGLESVMRRNPDIAIFGPKAVATIALKEMTNANPKLWSVGEGQIEEYLGEVGRGEVGPEMKARLEALFPAKSLKRHGR